MEIYKSTGYTNENPLVDIYTRNPDGEWSKETVNAKEIDLEICSFAEMRAAMVYLKESGVITDDWIYIELSRVLKMILTFPMRIFVLPRGRKI